MIIATVSSKGGVGKSTISGSLAVWLMEQGYSVVFADCDTQQSCAEWLAGSFPEIPIERFSSSEEVLGVLAALSKKADYVVADGPGSQSAITRALLLRADLVLIPTKASYFETRALLKNTAFVEKARSIRSGKPRAVAVLTMVSKRFRLTNDMKVVAKELGLSLATSQLSQRQAFADAPGQGTVVWRMGPSATEAAREMLSLFDEILSGVSNRGQRYDPAAANAEHLGETI